ncbi:MAG TPA: hypothetical protein VJY62_19745 [Bacteroidia bacterium]|nr:hypothetical protein [Bacteroidia bacterium]
MFFTAATLLVTVYLSYWFSVESLYGEFTGIKRWGIFGNHFKQRDFIESNFLLLDVNHDISAAYSDFDISDKDIDKIPLVGVPNRKKLATVLKWLYANQNLYEVIISDVLFTKKSLAYPEKLPKHYYDSLSKSYRDTVLLTYINYDDSIIRYFDLLDSKRKIIAAGEYNGNAFEKDILSGSHFNPDSRGYVNCSDDEQTRFLNYKLARCNSKNKTFLSLPLKMYERINHKTISANGRELTLNIADSDNRKKKFKFWGFYLNQFVPEFYYNQKDIDNLLTYAKSEFPDSERVSLITLNESYVYPERIKKILLSDQGNRKSIFIGSFDRNQSDKHDVLQAGMMNGSSIILNVYYNLRKQQNKLSIVLIISLIVLYFIILSIYVSQTINNIILTIVAHIGHELHYYGLAFLLIIVSFCFNVTMRIIVLEVLLFIAGLLLRGFKIVIKKKQSHGE